MTGSIQGGLGCLGAAIGVGLVGFKAAEAVGRNPGASTKILVQAIIVFKFAGPKLIIKDLFGNKADKAETPAALYALLSVIFVLVGFIEVFSILIRPFTLSVRLFGNVFGGENLLHGTNFLFVFYFMEALVGLIQAFVFTLLMSVYIGLLCNHGDEHHDDHKEAAH